MAGSNCTVSVTALPGFNVAGKLAPDRLKPVPVSVAELMVTGAAPVEVRVTDCVAALFSCTFPKATLVALMLSVGTAAFNCRPKVLETLPELAVRVTDCALVTGETVAVNPALVAVAGTVIVAGTVTAALLLERLTLSPPLAADEVSVTVHASVPDPVMELVPQVSVLNAAGAAVPVPARPMTAEEPEEELLPMLS